MGECDQDFIDGYNDGRDPNAPEPSGNRHPAYKHSFEVARAELNNQPIPAHVSRARAKLIEDNTNDQ